MFWIWSLIRLLRYRTDLPSSKLLNNQNTAIPPNTTNFCDKVLFQCRAFLLYAVPVHCTYTLSIVPIYCALFIIIFCRTLPIVPCPTTSYHIYCTLRFWGSATIAPCLTVSHPVYRNLSIVLSPLSIELYLELAPGNQHFLNMVTM